MFRMQAQSRVQAEGHESGLESYKLGQQAVLYGELETHRENDLLCPLHENRQLSSMTTVHFPVFSPWTSNVW